MFGMNGWCKEPNNAGNGSDCPKNAQNSEDRTTGDLISRAEAIDELNKGAWGVEWDKTLAKTMIESLPSAQPTQNTRVNSSNALDTISREAAIDEIKALYEWHDIVTEDRAIEHLKKLPSAQPEQQWLPCSERLPEEKTDVLLAFKNNMAVGFWEDILMDGVPAWYANSGDGWMTDTENVDSDGIPIAWMPLPEPYKGGEDE